MIFEDGESTLQLFQTNDGYKDRNLLFLDCPLTKVYLRRNLSFYNTYGITNIPFYYNTNIKAISIGKYVTEAESFVPVNYEDLQEISCYNPNPPSIRSFSNFQYTNVIVNIPIGFLSNYQNHKIWGNFWNLKESLTSDIVAEKIMLNVKKAELNLREVLQLEVMVLPENASDKTVTWSSSNESIAKVSEDGLGTAISTGTSVIIAFCGEASEECLITILDDSGVESLLNNPDSKITVYSTNGVLIKKIVK